MFRALIISPQPWEGFQVSKHHYARALADHGWEVIFVDPPTDLGRPGKIEISNTSVPNLRNLRYQTGFPYKLKFHARWLFDNLMGVQAKRIARVTGPLDLVWDLDNAYQFRSLRSFGARKSLFHLVDNVDTPGLGDKQADHFIYLHHSFCTHAGSVPDPVLQVGHGLGRAHAVAPLAPMPKCSRSAHVGYVGNIASKWLDWDIILGIVTKHPNVRFTFWGPLPGPALIPPALQEIMNRRGTAFPGLTSPEIVASAAADVDIWLAPFGTGGTINSHKVLEYLSTGRAIVMDWLEAYDGNSLVSMPKAPGIDGLPDLLDRALEDLPVINSPAKMAERRTYALERTYDRRLEQIAGSVGIDLNILSKLEQPHAP